MHADARLTGLKCEFTDLNRLIRLITEHVSLKNSLVLCHDYASGDRNNGNLATLMPNVLKTLRSLDIFDNSSFVDMSQLQTLCEQLEELKLGHRCRGTERDPLKMSDIEDMVVGLRDTYRDMETLDSQGNGEMHEQSVADNHDYLSISNKSKSRLAIISTPVQEIGIQQAKPSILEVLDISYMQQSEKLKITNSVLLSEQSLPLHTIVLKFNHENKLGTGYFRTVFHNMGWRMTRPSLFRLDRVSIHRM